MLHQFLPHLLHLLEGKLTNLMCYQLPLYFLILWSHALVLCEECAIFRCCYLLHRKGFYEEAVVLLNKAIKEEKNETSLYINRGGLVKWGVARIWERLETNRHNTAYALSSCIPIMLICCDRCFLPKGWAALCPLGLSAGSGHGRDQVGHLLSAGSGPPYTGEASVW